jgi:transposase
MSKLNPPRAGGFRRSYDEAFKRDAVNLAHDIGFAKAAADLDVAEGNLHRWARKIEAHGKEAFLPASKRSDLEAQLKRLQEENKVLKQERDILKKAAAFFAKENG